MQYVWKPKATRLSLHLQSDANNIETSTFKYTMNYL